MQVLIMSFWSYIKRNFQIFGIISIISLTLTNGILNLLQLNPLWLYVTICFIIYLLFIILIVHQKSHLDNNNIDSFSIIALIAFPTTAIYPNYSAGSKYLIYAINSLISVAFIIFFLRNKHKEISKLSMKQVAIFFVGLIIGLIIAIVKIQLNNSNLLNLSINFPIQFIYSIIMALSLSIVSEEFLYRGLLWGYLRDKGVNDNWIIVISALLWGISHVDAYQSIIKFVNIIVLGIILGFLVKKTKSIDISIGAHAGYNSFLIFQALFFK